MQRGLTLERVAHELSTTPETVGRWERGQRCPHQRHLQALADLFGLDAIDLARQFRPAAGRNLLSRRRDELLREDPALVEVEHDPFAWRLRNALHARRMSTQTFARMLEVDVRTVRRWQTGPHVPDWATLWRAADLLDVPVWWWRCGGEEEQAMYGPYDLVADDDHEPPSAAERWQFAQRVADQYQVPVLDIVRTAYPDDAGWRHAGALDAWTPPPAPPLPIGWRLQLAVSEWAATHNQDFEDAITWICDLCSVTDTTVRRWLSGDREPRWREASLAAAALETPVWRLWAPGETIAVTRP